MRNLQMHCADYPQLYKELAKLYLKQFMHYDRKTNCREWTGSMYSNGYGFVTIPGSGKSVSVHRLAAHLWKGFDLNADLVVCHRCDNRKCFNPKHLWIGTQSDNIKDGFIKGRMSRGSAHANSKLNEADVVAILDAVHLGMSQTGLARKYGIRESSITLIKQRKAWKHVKWSPK